MVTKKAPSKKVAMVQPVPAKPAIKLDLVAVLLKLGNDRAYTLLDDKPGYWLVHFEGDREPTKILK